MPAKGHETYGRLMSVDATIVCWRAQGATDVRAERQRPKTGGQRRGGPAGGAARRAAEIPRIVGRSVNVVVALPVAQNDGHIGLAEDESARCLEAGDRDCVFLCYP